mgnify:CR=1 FL=1
MADISITASAVTATLNRGTITALAGATITAGQVVYADPATGAWLLADANSATVAARVPAGIALNGGVINQPVTVITSGLLTMNAVLTVGAPFYLSANPGGIAPGADLVSGWFPSFLGFAASTTVLMIDIQSGTAAI